MGEWRGHAFVVFLIIVVLTALQRWVMAEDRPPLFARRRTPTAAVPAGPAAQLGDVSKGAAT